MTIESRIIHIAPSDVVNIPYAARSISLTVKGGSVTVVIGANPAVVVTTGMSHTWAVDGTDEILVEDFTFTGDGTADAYLTITRE